MPQRTVNPDLDATERQFRQFDEKQMPNSRILLNKASLKGVVETHIKPLDLLRVKEHILRSSMVTPEVKEPKGKKKKEEKLPAGDPNLFKDVDPGDYLIALNDKRKKVLVQALEKGEAELSAVVDNEKRADPKTQEVIKLNPDNLVANLGKRPQPGSAYGVKVEPYIKTTELKPWGKVHWFTEYSDAQYKMLTDNLTQVAKKLAELKLTAGLPIDIYLRPAKGKHSANFKTTGQEGDLDTLTFTLKDRDFSKWMLELIWHEMGHYLQFNFFTKELTKRWVKIFHNYVKVNEVPQKEIEKLRDAYLKTDKGLEEFAESLPEDSLSSRVMEQIIDYITTTQNLNPKDFDRLVSDDRSRIKEFWPRNSFDLTNTEPVLSDYATQSPLEFFGEAFGKTMVGDKKVPENIRKAVQTTLNELKGSKVVREFTQ